MRHGGIHIADLGPPTGAEPARNRPIQGSCLGWQPPTGLSHGAGIVTLEGDEPATPRFTCDHLGPEDSAG